MVSTASSSSTVLITSRDIDVSHIASGYWYNSAKNGKVRVDETYDGAFGSSLFDFTNTSNDGGVMNHQIIVGPSVGSEPTCFDDFVQAPGFPLITEDFLISSNATFGGVVQEPFLGPAQTVSATGAFRRSYDDADLTNVPTVEFPVRRIDPCYHVSQHR